MLGWDRNNIIATLATMATADALSGAEAVGLYSPEGQESYPICLGGNVTLKTLIPTYF